ncbi:VCBS repeat-containing protein [uncultured Desulfovibrio sp.]|uniref:FG-GAP repeat domain-containing protein n=1 Tax=uncultured Desulfovibrio sp. TaxID=167968 RepID=UPI0026389E41|nr:VCBS repeat-containing protein [uncultured Desulfovibrio sp.]
MKRAMQLALAACLMLVMSLQASAALAAQKSVVVLPFAVNAPQSYAYLSKALPSTIVAKLNRPGVLSARMGSTKAASAAHARQAMGGSDYAVWGSVKVAGNDCTVELNSVARDGQQWSKAASGPVSGLTSSVQQLANALTAEAFGLGGRAAGGSGGSVVMPGRSYSATGKRSDIIVNETGQNQAYLNPQFRYQGAGSTDGSRLRTQRIPDAMVDMAVGDFNGDGKNEVAVLTDHKLLLYKWDSDGRLKPLAEHRISATNLCYSMRSMDFNRDGADDLVVATFSEEDNRPYSYFFTLRGNKVKEYTQRIPYFASVMKLPPHFTPTLVGQGWDSVNLFARGVHVLVKTRDGFSLGQRINLPSGANVFNCAWIPAKGSNHSDQLVMLTENDQLKVFQGSQNTLVHTTMERFSGSATGMDHYKSMPGLGVDKTYQLPSRYYAPMRLIVADIGNTGENCLIINKPISTASQLFDRYRYFPQGEIHALFWDGVGLALKWKTRRIRGSVAEADLGDVNNDGVLDLVVGVNTSPSLGVGSRQSMLLAYPLDVSKVDPNTPVDMSDFEVNPN